MTQECWLQISYAFLCQCNETTILQMKTQANFYFWCLIFKLYDADLVQNYRLFNNYHPIACSICIYSFNREVQNNMEPPLFHIISRLVPPVHISLHVCWKGFLSDSHRSWNHYAQYAGWMVNIENRHCSKL